MASDADPSDRPVLDSDAALRARVVRLERECRRFRALVVALAAQRDSREDELAECRDALDRERRRRNRLRERYEGILDRERREHQHRVEELRRARDRSVIDAVTRWVRR